MNLNKPRKTEKIKNDSGFTLIEVLIAVAIFAIGFLAVGAMQINALNTTNSARQTTEALTVAEDQAEQLRALPFYIDNAYNESPLLTNGDHTAAPDTTPFTARWTVANDVPLSAYEAGVLTSGTVPRSKAIRVWVTPDNNAADILATIVFAKFMALDGN